MNLGYTEEQVMFERSAQRFVKDAYGFETYLKVEASPQGYSPAVWKKMAEMGWTSLIIPSEDGGQGLGAVELLQLMEALGRGLCIEPYLANAVLSAQIITSMGSAKQRAELLPGLIDGSRQISFAHSEVDGRFNRAHCATRAKAQGAGYRLDGRKSLVLNAPNADQIVVLARTSGGLAEEGGLSLFVVDARAAGVSLRPYKVLGGGVAADVILEDVAVSADALLGEAGAAHDAVGDVIDLATAASCADAYGAMQALLEKTVSYMKTRKQFGQPLSSMQVIQHRLVDMFIEVQQTQSMILMASIKLLDPSRAERQKAVSACKAYVHKASKFVAQWAVQLHGGIGMTEELEIGHYFRRLTAFGNLFGDREHHLTRFVALTQEPAGQRSGERESGQQSGVREAASMVA